MGKTLDLDTFGEIMNDIIKRSDIKLLIEMPGNHLYLGEVILPGSLVAGLVLVLFLNYRNKHTKSK